MIIFFFFAQYLSQSWYSASPQTWQDWCNLSEIMAYWKAFQCSQDCSRVTEPGRNLCRSPALPLWPKAGSTPLQQSLREPIKWFVGLWLITTIVHLHCTFSKHMQSLHTFCYYSGTDLQLDGENSEEYLWTPGNLPRQRQAEELQLQTLQGMKIQ